MNDLKAATMSIRQEFDVCKTKSHSRSPAGNCSKLTQALMNLIGNALKFTPAGGRISVSLTESQGAPEGYGFYIFKVRDTQYG